MTDVVADVYMCVCACKARGHVISKSELHLSKDLPTILMSMCSIFETSEDHGYGYSRTKYQSTHDV